MLAQFTRPCACQCTGVFCAQVRLIISGIAACAHNNEHIHRLPAKHGLARLCSSTCAWAVATHLPLECVPGGQVDGIRRAVRRIAQLDKNFSSVRQCSPYDDGSVGKAMQIHRQPMAPIVCIRANRIKAAEQHRPSLHPLSKRR